ncbi:MAG TPA: glycoside hydrolase family 99-like domain-containing protein [Candidatus Hydrogenedentes bacterium]|nr:glycoside hydrolase family 99-like domain-containing protein [Candidatus Hydrogenedentota bacterium]
MLTGLLAGCLLVFSADGPTRWDFTDPATVSGWLTNANVSSQEVTREGWRLVTTGRDPQLTSQPIDVEIEDFALLYLNIRASRDGECQVFWSHEDGPMMGFSEDRSRRFAVNGHGADTEAFLLPGWTRGSVIHRLRFDPFGDAEFVIREIRIVYPFKDLPKHTSIPPVPETVLPIDVKDPSSSTGSGSPWFLLPNERTVWCGPLDVDLSTRSGLLIQTDYADTEQIARPWHLYWVVSGESRAHEVICWLWPRREPQWIRLDRFPAWTGKIEALGVKPPQSGSFKALHLAEQDISAPWPVITRFCKMDPVWRAGRPCIILTRLANQGGGTVDPAMLTVSAVDETGRPLSVRPRQEAPGVHLQWGEHQDLFWDITAEHPGRIQLTVTGAEYGGITKIFCDAMPPVAESNLDYVPAPVAPSLPFDVCAYYFPGWKSAEEWQCILEHAPERRPALGFYDESNPECVDWQIKWSVEHGITCYLVDWYWVQGRQFLTHWFEAYRKARYRDMLKVAVMWANHNPPGTHSREDWRQVTREWVEHYFNLPAYFRIDEKPAIFLWDPRGLLRDLGSPEEMAAALADSQQIAQEAGYAGISFVAMGYGYTSSELSTLQQAGFIGWTTYHEWEHAAVKAWSRQEVSYREIAESAPKAWEERLSHARKAGLTYYPVLDTGWDARPWHGNTSMVITGRAPADFGQLAESARDFALREKLPFVVVGPVNEWGEGSYIEPNAEYGMSQLKALRRGLTGMETDMPEEIYPSDIGRGPYEFSLADLRRPVWPFTPDAAWNITGNGTSVAKEPAGWRLTISGAPPVLSRKVYGINASCYSHGTVRMSVSPVGNGKSDDVITGHIRIESMEKEVLADKTFSVQADGIEREYSVDLGGDNPKWTGRPATVSIVPVDRSGYEVFISSILLVNESGTSAKNEL